MKSVKTAYHYNLRGNKYMQEPEGACPMTNPTVQTITALALLLKGVMARINPNLWTGYI